MQNWEFFGLSEFLSRNPRLRLVEYGVQQIVIEGEYALKAQVNGFDLIEESFLLRIIFPRTYPKSIPMVIEKGRFFPRDSKFHTYKDGSFCLGSEINIKSILRENHSISRFFEKIVDPFLYSVTYKIKHDIYPLGELAHGENGLIEDYEKIFKVKGKKNVMRTIAALGKRKREANKLSCPCGCGLRLGKCEYRFFLNNWRFLDKRRWFREYLSTAFKPIEKLKK